MHRVGPAKSIPGDIWDSFGKILLQKKKHCRQSIYILSTYGIPGAVFSNHALAGAVSSRPFAGADSSVLRISCSDLLPARYRKYHTRTWGHFTHRPPKSRERTPPRSCRHRGTSGERGCAPRRHALTHGPSMRWPSSRSSIIDVITGGHRREFRAFPPGPATTSATRPGVLSGDRRQSLGSTHCPGSR
jgi:hypothetical protein